MDLWSVIFYVASGEDEVGLRSVLTENYNIMDATQIWEDCCFLLWPYIHKVMSIRTRKEIPLQLILGSGSNRQKLDHSGHRIGNQAFTPNSQGKVLVFHID